jgi:ribosomal-protein-alanine N-acetyltransferase
LKDKTIDIGYRFHKRNWNKGYATESARAIIGYGFNNYDLTEIIGNAAEDNIGSIRVFQKLGMELVSKREYDALRRAVLYKILKSTF